MSERIETLYEIVDKAYGLDRLAPLDTILEKGKSEANLRAMPESSSDFEGNAELVVRMKQRLHYLGYLDQSNKSPKLDNADRKAIRSFQTEAGITVDGWVGKESWEVLENLFSFEADSHIDRWTAHEKFLPLLRRAVQLRLYAFGLLKTPPSEKLSDTQNGLDAFVSIVSRLKLTDQQLAADYSHNTLSFLFNQNKITQQIYLRAKEGTKAHEKEEKSFIVCNARIELWLLGYPILPNGKGTYKKPSNHPKKRNSRNRKYREFYTILKDFAQDVNPSRSKKLRASQFANDYTPFFAEFVNAQHSAVTDDSKTQTDLLLRTIEQNPEMAAEEWHQRRSFSGRLWDGTKRAWGWIVRFLKRSIKATVTIVRNALRVIWRLSLHSINIVRAAIHSFPAAIDFLFKPDVEGSSIKTAVFNHDADFDWNVFIPEELEIEKYSDLVTKLRLRVKQFIFSVRIVRLLGVALIQSLKISMTGYLSLYAAIARISPELDEFMNYYLENKEDLLPRT